MTIEIPDVSVRPPGRRLITFQEAMTLGRWRRNKTYELIATGKIVAYKDGARTMIDADSIVAYQSSLPRATARPRAPQRKRRA